MGKSMLVLALTMLIGLQSEPQQPRESAADRAANIAAISTATIATIPEFKRLLDAELLDYENARFRDVRLYEIGLKFCGYVNAKNAMGGYVGWRRFSAFHHENYTSISIQNAQEPWITFDDCKEPMSDKDYSSQFAAP